MSRRKPESLRTLREWLRAVGGLRYCGDVEAYTREGLDEFRSCSHRRRGRAIQIRLPSRSKPIVHAPGVARGMSLDDATEAATEAGFFHARPSIAELVDAMGEDLRHPDAPFDEPTAEELERDRARGDMMHAALEWLNRDQKRAGARRNRRLAA